MDEVDQLVDLGFAAEVEALVKACPTKRQTLLFSATMTAKVGTYKGTQEGRERGQGKRERRKGKGEKGKGEGVYLGLGSVGAPLFGSATMTAKVGEASTGQRKQRTKRKKRK